MPLKNSILISAPSPPPAQSLPPNSPRHAERYCGSSLQNGCSYWGMKLLRTHSKSVNNLWKKQFGGAKSTNVNLGTISTLSGISSNNISNLEPDDLRELILDVSSEQLWEVVGSQYSSIQLRDGLENNMPQDLTMLAYNSTNEGIQANIANFQMSNEFSNALKDLDLILENCNNYADSVNIISSLDLLLNQRSLHIENLTEREAFIGGVILAKYSFRYWAANQSLIDEMFIIYSTSSLNGTILGFQVNPVKSDVRGMAIGGIRGAITGGMWGSAAPGIGTALGAVAGGILGAGVSGATSSLAAGIYIAIFH